jgi:hypothetical protein
MAAASFSLNDLSAFGGSTYDIAPPAPPAPAVLGLAAPTYANVLPTSGLSMFAPAAPAPSAAPAAAAPASGLSAFESAISGLSSLAAPWYTSITGNSVIPLPTSAANAALQQTQIQQQAQAKLLATAPTAAGLLANPTVVLIGVAVFGLLFYMISKK